MGNVTVMNTENGIGGSSSNSGLVYYVYFRTNTLGEDISSHSNYRVNSKVYWALNLDGSQSKGWTTVNSKL